MRAKRCQVRGEFQSKATITAPHSAVLLLQLRGSRLESYSHMQGADNNAKVADHETSDIKRNGDPRSA